MSTYLSETLRTAKKDYSCGACEAIREGGVNHFVERLTFSEKRLVAAARKDKWRVLAGTKYVDYRGICDGSAYTLRMRPEIQALVSKYDWWPEE